ncbi:MAG: Dipeptide transport system permease protein DppB [Betaproteobacteria bacterium ADurb.Bin341]|nr:MAG: Dipeptide transport system permease protein DppB [Betaproteobacteria bacterium ADurb.Bin341]
MTRYLLSKLGQAFVTVVLVMLVVFTLLRFMPTAGYFDKEQWKDMTDQEKTNFLRNLGVLDPMPVQLKNFVVNLFHGNLGTSITLYPKTPIANVLGDKIGYSILLNLISWIVSASIGMPLGLAMAKSRGGMADKLGTVYVVIIRAVPSIIIHFIIQIFFSRWFKLPLLFYMDQPLSWILPTVSMSIGTIAGYGVWLRRYIVDEENRDYIKFARVKGLPQNYIMWRHVFRNAIVPIAINIPSDFLLLLSGSLVIERLYSIPGTGGLLIKSVVSMDNPLVQVLVLLYGALSVTGVFLGDIFVSFIDPRIKLVDSKD